MNQAVVAAQPTPLVPATAAGHGLGQRWQALPGRTQAMAVFGIAALVAVLALMFSGARDADYRVLLPNLSEKNGDQVIDRLVQMNVPYRFAEGGSRGAKLVAGEREVKIHGEMVPVRADVHQLEGFSGHADRNALLAWLRQLRRPPQQTFVVHGEPDAADALRSTIRNELGWERTRVPQHGESVTL